MALYMKYKELFTNKNKEGIEKLLQNANAEELTELIVPRILHNNAVQILDDILKVLATTDNSELKRRKVVESVLSGIKKADISNAHANTLILRIFEDFSKYSKTHLLYFVDYCLNSIRNNDDNFFSWKDILPEILQILEEEKYVNYKGTEMSGTDYKSQIISSICNQPWALEILTPLTTMFNTISMEQNDHGTVIRAVCSKVSEVKHNELPPLVHQLLKLSDKQDGRLVIGTLQKYFSNIYAEIPNDSPDAMDVDSIGHISLNEVQDTESTVLYHIRQSALLNQSSIKDFLRHLKNIINAPELVLKPFSMSVLLLVSDIYEDQVFDLITHAISRKIQDDEKRNSAWVKQILQDNYQLADIVDQIIDNSTKDRHLVIKGLVDLAFALMEPKSKENEDNLLHEIGVKIIKKLMKMRHEIGPTVIQRLASKIVGSGTSVSQYVECLNFMCRKSTLIVLDSQAWILTLLEQLLVIPGVAAIQVLQATLPLMRVSTSIRDSLILILRKALYRKGIDVRKMAVTGFLQFLTNLKIESLNFSQTSSSTNISSTSGSIYTQATIEKNVREVTRPNPKHNSIFCHEILGILKRCFCHEYQVRQHLYSGLYDTVVHNPELAEFVIDMLLINFSNYYESDEDIKPPLKFHDCSTIAGAEAILQEPIGDLIFALQKIYCNAALKDTPSIDELSLYLESLCRRMAHVKLEHLNIEDQEDLLDNLPKVQQKVLSYKLMATTLEALIAFRINAWSPENKTTASSINSLFKAYYELYEFSKRASKSKKIDSKKKKNNNTTDTTINKKSRGKVLKLPPTIIDMGTIRKIISLLYEPTVPFATEEQTAILKNRAEFHIYSLQTCISIFQNAKSLHKYERLKHWEKYKKDYLEIGGLLYKHIVANLDCIREFNEEVALTGLECFKEFCDVMCTTFSTKIPEFLNKIDQFSSSQGVAIQYNGLIFSMQTLIDTYYEEEIEVDSAIKKIPLLIFEIISLLLQKTILYNTKIDQIFEWLKKLARSDKFDTSIAIIILQLITMIEERDAEYGKILDDMSVELCKKFGTIDNSEIDVREVYGILNNNAIMPQAHTIFNNSLKNKINNASWILGRLKAEQIYVSTAGISDESHRDELIVKERSLCRHLSHVIQTLESLSNARINPGPNTDATFKNLQNLYNTVNNLTKYFISKSTAQNPAFQAVKFIQVVQLAGKPLKTTFYNLITYTEENQSSTHKNDVHALRNKVLKETKFIPKVVYEIEQFNKEILALGKKTGTSLDTYIKHSITRDFRIKQGELAEGLEKLDITQMTTQKTQNEQNREENNTSTELDILDTTETHESSTDCRQSPPLKRSKHDDS